MKMRPPNMSDAIVLLMHRRSCTGMRTIWLTYTPDRFLPGFQRYYRRDEPCARCEEPLPVSEEDIEAYYASRRRKTRTAFRHSFDNRIAPKGHDPLVTRTDGCGKDKRHRRSEASQFPCTRKECALVARPIRDEREHIAEERMHERELADLDAIAWDDQHYWDYYWDEREWRDWNASLDIYEVPVWQVQEEAAELAFDEMDALMREAPLGAEPVRGALA